MGAVKADLHAKERRLAETYALDTPDGVKKLFADTHALRSLVEGGDFDAVGLLLDMAKAMELAKLTKRQREVLYWRYEKDLSTEMVGEIVGIRHPNVIGAESLAFRDIAAVYEAWARRGEGYSVSDVLESSLAQWGAESEGN
jgi:DNA-directed RNA polymerase specialized sigma24 family protein